MVPTPPPTPAASSPDDDIVRRFLEGTLDREAWTHEAHLLVCRHLLATSGTTVEALDRLRPLIERHNARVGVRPGHGGYHETITQYFVGATAHAHPPTIASLLAEPALQRDAPGRHWSPGLLASPEAARAWVEPDLAPLPWPHLAAAHRPEDTMTDDSRTDVPRSDLLRTDAPRPRDRAWRAACATVAVCLLGASAAMAPARRADAATTTILVTQRVSVTTGGSQISAGILDNGGATPAALVDGTGRYVAFTTSASLVATDTNAKLDVYRRDRLTGRTERVSVADDGSQLPLASKACGISGTGRWIGFRSEGANWPSDQTGHVFMRDTEEGTTVRISEAGDGTPAGLGASAPNNPCPISDSGTAVAFATQADNLDSLDPNTTYDIYLRRLDIDTTTLVSASSGGSAGNAHSTHPALSANGGVVAFASDATNLVAGDTNAKSDVFVRVLATGTTTRASVNSAEAQSPDSANAPDLSATGRYVAFHAGGAGMDPDDDDVFNDVYRRDLQAGTTILVSRTTSGVKGDDRSQLPAISADGRYVAFTSEASNLYPVDVNGAFDVYRRDLVLERTDLMSRVQGSISTGNTESGAPTMSADGMVVAFPSKATQLVAGDTNAKPDAFVRDTALDLAPFGSASTFAARQRLDFEGAAASPAVVAQDAAAITAGSTSPDSAILARARDTAWSAERGPLTRLYWAYFLRIPDLGGMTYWTGKLDGGTTLAQVAAKFATSSEFQTKYGALDSAGFVTAIYQNIFDRDPDAGGLAFWTGKLDNGALTRGDVMVAFSESSEGKRLLQPQCDLVLVWLGMLGTMPPKASFAAALAAIAGGAAVQETIASIRHQPAYAARVLG